MVTRVLVSALLSVQTTRSISISPPSPTRIMKVSMPLVVVDSSMPIPFGFTKKS